MFACISMCVRMVYVGDTAYTCEHTCRVQRKTSEVLGFHYFLETVSLAGPGIRFDSQQAPMIHMFSSPTPVGLQAGAMYSVLHMGDGIQSQVYRLPKSASALIRSPSPQPHNRLLLGIVKTPGRGMLGWPVRTGKSSPMDPCSARFPGQPCDHEWLHAGNRKQPN